MSASTARFLKEAVHHDGALSGQGLQQRLFTFWFNSFVYNQIWEDPRVDLEALEITPESRILTISSGGCNALNYLLADPARVTVVDLNRSHLCLLRLKIAAMQHLPSHEDFFRFFGCGDQKENVTNYRRYIAPHLDAQTRRFWEGRGGHRALLGPRINYFGRNFYDHSKLGCFLHLLHAITHATGRRPERLLEAASLEEQRRIYEEEIAPMFDHWLVRCGGRLPLALYSLGIPPQQFEAMKREAGRGLIETYQERVRRLACGFPLQDNYFTWQAFGRRYDRERRRAVPDYLKREHYEMIRGRLGRIDSHLATVRGLLEAQAERAVNAFVLLDSQDWMRPHEIAAQWAEIARVGRPGARVIFRTAGESSPIESALPPELRGRFRYEAERSRELLARDRSAVYGGFHLYRLADG